MHRQRALIVANVLKIKVSELKLHNLTIRALHHTGIHTIADMHDRGIFDPANKVKSLGKARLQEIVESLKALGAPHTHHKEGASGHLIDIASRDGHAEGLEEAEKDARRHVAFFEMNENLKLDVATDKVVRATANGDQFLTLISVFNLQITDLGIKSQIFVDVKMPVASLARLIEGWKTILKETPEDTLRDHASSIDTDLRINDKRASARIGINFSTQVGKMELRFYKPE